LTKIGGRIILKPMKKKLAAGILFALLPLVSTTPQSQEKPPPEANPPVGTVPAQKPKYDYMSSFLSRDTRPLGLKEDQALKKLLRQRAMKWAVRTGTRHILD
jgi:hypothetical protein